MAISESALSNKIKDDKIEIPGYNVIRYDLIGNHTHGGALIYYRQDLSAKQRTDFDVPTYTLVLEMSIYRKKVFFVSSYRKHGQADEDFAIYSKKFDELMEKISLENPFAIIVTGDYNSHNKKWYHGDGSDKFGLAIQETFEKYGLTQMVDQPTYFGPKSNTLVDLFATNQPNLVIANEIHPSPDDRCHHQINFAKLNLKCTVPDPIKRFIWHYSRADVESLRKACFQFDWEIHLNSLANPEDQVVFFDETILNIATNFIPGEVKTFYPKDPPWLTKACKNLYHKYRRRHKSFIRRGCPPLEKNHIDGLKQEYSDLVQKERDMYMQSLGSAVSDPRTGQKKYWTALKKLLNNKVSTIIPPIFHNGSYITDISEKCVIFNNYFKNQCTLVATSSTLPTLVKSTNLILKDVNFTMEDITTHINKLNVDKAHGHDGISS